MFIFSSVTYPLKCISEPILVLKATVTFLSTASINLKIIQAKETSGLGYTFVKCQQENVQLPLDYIFLRKSDQALSIFIWVVSLFCFVFNRVSHSPG